ncbi:transglutaminase family protein [Pseudacidovorax intermedius]|uniref:Transglutaminase n=1 Tax=Pseudacidovorax intermedius TaxID=433924 RepID=A0A147GPH1_9BURK|nr:transglutaminase family protein [Pseudacidovorax intermedius]KTT16105.1 transglutaminase [Pseudacidovorax intermedius]
MLLHVTHETCYDYAPAVQTAQHLAHLRPRELPWQAVLDHRLAISPEPAHRRESDDLYGNRRTFFAFESTHEQLVVTARSLVRTAVPDAPAAALAAIAWEPVRERFRYRAGRHDDPASDFVFPSRHVPQHDDFVAYARTSFGAGRPLFEAAMDLTLRIYRDFDYDSGSTEISTPAVTALAQRRGVCQDFAHIMIACCRALGLPARYVSGYLLTQPPPGQPRLVGADASHAWVEVYLPGPGDEAGVPAAGVGEWVGFDPTNGRQPGEDYVVLAMGRDFADVSPMRGVLHGGARHVLDVGVTVQPFDELPAAQRERLAPALVPADGAPVPGPGRSGAMPDNR